MTIVIKKGSDAQRKKRLKLRAASRGQNEGSDEEHDDTRSSATDMTDVLDFKVYRIIKPNFYNNTTRVNLIGENFYREEDQAKIEDLVSHNSNAEVEQLDDLTALERMQSMQHQNGNVVRVRKTELLNRILESEKEVRALKSGHSIGKYLVPPTLEETVQWAIKFVAVRQEVLMLNIVNTYHDMKKYDASVERLAKQRKKRSASEQEERSRATSEDMANRERTSSDDFVHTGRDRTASTMSDSDTGGGGRDRTVSGVSDASWDIPAFDKRRSSSRLLSVGANDLALAAAGDKLQATQQATGRAKHVSLAQQLEQIKSQGTDTFLKSIVPQKDPIFPAGKRTWKAQNSHQSPQKMAGDSNGQRESTGSLGNVSETSKPQPPTTSKTGASENPRNPHLAKHAPGLSSTKSGKEVFMLHSGGVLAALPEEPAAPDAVSVRPAAPVTVRSGSAGDSNGKRVQSPPASHSSSGTHQQAAGRSQKHQETSEEQHSVVDHNAGTGTHQPRPPSGSKPSHRDSKPGHGTIRAASPTHAQGASAVRPAEGTSSKHHHIEPPKASAIQSAVQHSQRIISALLKKTEAMQSRIARKIRRAENAGIRLLEQHQEFHNAVEEAGEKAIIMFEEREFTRPIALLHQVSSFEEGAECKTSSLKVKVGLKNDLHNMHIGAEKKTFELYMSRLVKHRWFVAAVLKLRDHMKKMNNAVPECCLKMIVAVEQVLLMGYSLTEEVFYQILEGVVTVKEDHQKTIVHQLLKILRDALSISAVDFLQYLEDQDIIPHPELSNQVRMQAKAQSKKNISASLSIRTTLARLTQTSIHSPSHAKVAFMVPSEGIITAAEPAGTASAAGAEQAPAATTSTVTFSPRGAGRNTFLALGHNKNQGQAPESPRLAASSPEAAQTSVTAVSASPTA